MSPPPQVRSSLRSAATRTCPSSWEWRWACLIWTCPWSLRARFLLNLEPPEPRTRRFMHTGPPPPLSTPAHLLSVDPTATHSSQHQKFTLKSPLYPHGRRSPRTWSEEQRGCQHAAVTLPTKLRQFAFGARSLPTRVTLIVAMDTKHMWSQYQQLLRTDVNSYQQFFQM